MVSKRTAFLICALLIAIVLPTKALQSSETRPEKFNLSLPNLQIGSVERIAEFNVTVFHGFVVAVPRIPNGWCMHIDLPLQWKTVVTAGCIIGVAALTSDKTSYFKDFLVVEQSDPGEYPIVVNIEIKTETYNRESGLTKKQYNFTTKDVRLTKISP